MTKAEGSDLRSLIERVKQTTLDQKMAVLAHEQASRNLESFLWGLEHSKDKENPIDTRDPKA